jgi:hypothetical protein
MKYINAVKQIFTKLSLPDGLLEVLVGSGDYPDIYRGNFLAADRMTSLP